MDLKIGDKVRYTFPQSILGQNKTVEADVEYIGETFIKVRLNLDVIMKISLKNFDHIEKIKESVSA